MLFIQLVCFNIRIYSRQYILIILENYVCLAHRCNIVIEAIEKKIDLQHMTNRNRAICVLPMLLSMVHRTPHTEARHTTICPHIKKHAHDHPNIQPTNQSLFNKFHRSDFVSSNQRQNPTQSILPDTDNTTTIFIYIGIRVNLTAREWAFRSQPFKNMGIKLTALNVHCTCFIGKLDWRAGDWFRL